MNPRPHGLKLETKFSCKMKITPPPSHSIWGLSVPATVGVKDGNRGTINQRKNGHE
jgi:hypothetical protein